MEVLDLVELLADRGELDRLAGDRLDRERRAAARVSVELGQDHAVERDALVEGLRDGDGFLAGHRVEHEQDVRRLRRLPHRGELLHQRLVDVQAPGRVEDDHVPALTARLLDPVGDRLNRVWPCKDGDLELAAELLELLDGGRAREVGRDERGRVPFLAQEKRELRGGGRLARALQAGEQDHGRRLAGERELRAAAPHQRRQLLVDDRHDLLARREALGHVGAERPLAYARDEVLDDLEVDVGLEQRKADLAHRAGDRILVELAAAADVVEGGLEPV